MLDLLRERFQGLTPRARELVLGGDITLGQAFHYTKKKRMRAPTPSLHELAKHHVTAHSAVVQLTLVQARFITMRSLGKSQILEFAKANQTFAIPEVKIKADPRKPIRVRGDKPNFKRHR